MQHLRTSAVLMELLWFTSYFSCFLSGWADEFFFRISDLCCTLAYNSSSVLKSGWFYAISNLKDAHWSPWRENVRNQRLPHEVSSARLLLPVQQMICTMCETHRSNGWFPIWFHSGIFVGCPPAGLVVLYSWGSTFGFLPPCIMFHVSLGFWVGLYLHVVCFGWSYVFFPPRTQLFLSCWLPAVLLMPLWRQNLRHLSWECSVSSGLFCRLSR